MEWAQSHCVLHSVLARSMHACVQLSVQHVGSWLQTAVTHGSAPHVICARMVQFASHGGGEPVQHEGCAAHTSAAHGAKQSAGSSGPLSKQTECGHSGSGGHTPQS